MMKSVLKMLRLRILEMEDVLCRFELGDLSQKEKVGEGEVQDRGGIMQSCELWGKSIFFPQCI